MAQVRGVGIGLLVLGFFAVCASTAFGQTGEIAGAVRDTSGAVIPGVTVEAASPALIEKVRTAVTDNRGLYRIVDLRPGVYTVTFSLTGFNTLKREGIELSAAFTATVNAEMPIGALEETVTVSGQSPLVDVNNVRQQRVMTRDLIDSLPTGKTFQNLAVLVPGVVIQGTAGGPVGQDVGGMKGEGHVYLQVHGSRGVDMPLLFDGMRYNNMTLQGGGFSSSIIVNNGNVQEVNIEVGGQSVDSDVSGVRANIIPKDGGNTFRGFFAANFANDKLQSANVDAELRAKGVSQVTGLDKVWDINPAGGGPLKKERLWFYSAFRYWGVNDLPAGSFYNTNPLGWTFVPDVSRPGVNDTYQRSTNLRLTWQASPKNKVAAYYDIQQRCRCHFGLNATLSPEATNIYHATPNWLGQMTWTSTLSNRFLIEAGISIHPETFFHDPQPGVGPDTYSATEQSTGITFRAWNVPYRRYAATQVSSKLFASYITGTHAFKFGMQTQNGYLQQYQYMGGNATVSLLNGVPVALNVWTTPFTARDNLNANVSLLAQDQWKVRHLTLNLGARFDYLKSSVPEQHIAPARYVGARDFAAVNDVPNWKDISPRLGASYDLFGTGKTALKLSVGRYLRGITTLFADVNNPVFTSVNTATRRWDDLNSDFIPQEIELGPLSNTNFGKPNIVTRWDPDVLTGFGKRPYDWEVATGVQHELGAGFSASATYTRHWFGNVGITLSDPFRSVDNLLVTPSDYDPYCITAPADSRLPGGGGNTICGLYDITPDKYGLVNNLVTFPDKYGEAIERFDGVDASLIARLPRGIVLQGGTSTGRMRTKYCFVIDSPQQEYLCDVRPPFQTQVKVLGTYPLPWDAVVSATYQSLPGPQITASYVAGTGAIAPSLGRNLAGGLPTATIELIRPGTMYGERLHQVDFRLAKNIRVGRARFQGQFDLYNLFNANPVLALNTRYGPNWQQPTAILPGRLVKFGVQADF